MLELFTYPFMQRALVAGIIIALLLGWLGVYVISRNMSFVGDGVAHASLSAVALAILVGFTPLPTAIVFSILLAIAIHALKQKSSISFDAVIGILFTTGMALGIVLLQFHEGYVPDLMSYLFGNILTINTSDLWWMAGVGTLIIIFLATARRPLAFLTIDPEGSSLAGIPTKRIDLLLTIMISLSVVLSIKMIGIVLVSALLILPSASAKLLARSFHQFLVSSIILAVIMVLVGTILSYVLNMPTSAIIVLSGTCIFFVSLFLAHLRSLEKKESTTSSS